MSGLLHTTLMSIATGVGLGVTLAMLLLAISPRRGVALMHPKE